MFDKYRIQWGFTVSFIHLKKQNKLMLSFGNIDDYHDIILYDLIKSEWTGLSNGSNIIKLPTKLSCHSCVISSDERYLIVMGGFENGFKESYFVYILDMKFMVWKNNNVACHISVQRPNISMPAILFDSSLSKNGINLFIHGYLKNFQIYNLYLPMDIINIIKKMHSNDLIFVFDSIINDDQYGIHLDNLLKYY